MNISVQGNTLVLTSNIEYKGIELLKKVNPDALKLKDEDGNDIFSVGVGTNGGINKNGVVFDGKTRDENEFATVSVSGVPAEKEKAEKFVADTVLPVWGNLEKVAVQVTDAIGTYTEQKAALLEVTEIA